MSLYKKRTKRIETIKDRLMKRLNIRSDDLYIVIKDTEESIWITKELHKLGLGWHGKKNSNLDPIDVDESVPRDINSGMHYPSEWAENTMNRVHNYGKCNLIFEFNYDSLYLYGSSGIYDTTLDNVVTFEEFKTIWCQVTPSRGLNSELNKFIKNEKGN